MPQGSQHALAQHIAQHRLMAVTGDAVEDDARTFQAQLVAGEAMNQGGNRLALVAGINGQQHRHLQQVGEIGGGPPHRATRPVEETHDAFNDDDVGIAADDLKDPRDLLAVHGPGVEIKAGPPRGCLMEARVDIIRPHLGGGGAEPAIAQRPQNPQGHQGLAAARRRCGDHNGLSQSDSPAAVPCTNRAVSASPPRGRQRRWRGWAGHAPPRRRQHRPALSPPPAGAASRHWR